MMGLRVIRILSVLEGLSLLLLLLIAMPLKYAFDLPVAVRVVGSLHGVLFLALISAAIQVWLEGRLDVRRVLGVIAWSLAPFGFVCAARILAEQDADAKAPTHAGQS